MNASNLETNSLEEKALLLESVFKHLMDLVFVYDLASGTIQMRNPAMNKLVGLSENSTEAIGIEQIKGMIHADDLSLIDDMETKVNQLQEHEVASIELRIKTGQETYTYFLVRISIFKQEENGAKQLLAMAQDMSEKRKYELHKQRNINTLRELSFITSHELRHEYAKIQSIIQLVDNKFIDENERQVLLAEAKQSIQIINSSIFKINHKLSFNQNDSFFESTGVLAKFKKVLLVDDDALTNMLNKKIIQMVIKDMPIEIFTNPDDAINYLRTSDHEGDYLIFLDINFPEKNGWDFLNLYTKFDTKSKVIMLSSSIDNDDRNRARSYDMVIDYITKPLSVDFVEGILKG
jgi:PAS domain S-box-containing protein